MHPPLAHTPDDRCFDLRCNRMTLGIRPPRRIISTTPAKPTPDRATTQGPDRTLCLHCITDPYARQEYGEARASRQTAGASATSCASSIAGRSARTVYQHYRRADCDPCQARACRTTQRGNACLICVHRQHDDDHHQRIDDGECQCPFPKSRLPHGGKWKDRGYKPEYQRKDDLCADQPEEYADNWAHGRYYRWNSGMTSSSRVMGRRHLRVVVRGGLIWQAAR